MEAPNALRNAALTPGEFRILRRAARCRGDADALRRLRKWPETPRRARFRDAAWEMYVHEGEIEIDDNAIVSMNEEGGAYVMAWVYVSGEDLAAIEALPQHRFAWRWQ